MTEQDATCVLIDLDLVIGAETAATPMGAGDPTWPKLAGS